MLLLIDGLGDNYLTRRGAGGALARARRSALTSVFPSTTASAITTSYTGCTPLEHGLTGWFTYFGEAGCVAAALPFRSRGDMLPLGRRGVTPEQIYVSPSIFEHLPVRSIVVTHKDIVDSEYNARHCRGAQRLAYETLDELVAQVEAAVKSGAERKFIYAYWPVYDMVSHRFGAASAEAFAAFEAIDAAFGRLAARLSGTESLLIASADHGFIDVRAGGVVRAAGVARFIAQISTLRRAARCILPRARAEGIHGEGQGLARRARRRDAQPRSWSTKAGSARARRTRASPSASATSRW